jgi:acetate kinase
MAAALGGIDTLVFTGGIGEHSAALRAEIAAGLEHLGVRLDGERNARGDAIISRDGAPCMVRVVATDEERMVARHAARVLRGHPGA